MLYYNYRRKEIGMKCSSVIGVLVFVMFSLAYPSPGFAEGPMVKPETVGFSSERLQRFGGVLQQEIERGSFPGAVVLIARNGKIVYYEAYGFLDANKTKPMPKDARFRIASMTKPIVETAAMMMVEQGKFLLLDPISKYLPEFKNMMVEVKKADGSGYELVPAARPITIQDLMRHTSGFTYGSGLDASRAAIKDAYLKGRIEQIGGGISGDEMLKNLAKIPLVNQPGTTFEYSVSMDVMGLLLERVAGKPLDTLVNEMVLKPLKMNDTTFRLSRDKFPLVADPLDADPLKRTDWWKSFPPFEDMTGRYLMAGSGLISTAADYYRFSQMILNGGELDGVRLLSPKTVELMLSNHLQGMASSPAPMTGPGYGFGLGFAVRLDTGMAVVPGSKGDANWSGAGGTTFTIDPKERIVGIFMAAAPTDRVAKRLLFKDLLYGAVVK
jgi:CubicO group peptidase (beta-lactamase class C family)